MLRLLTIALIAGALAGCSSLGEKLPTELGGLPTGAPERPAQPHEYPAVHDMPPPRPLPAMSIDQQQKVEDDLRAARDRQERAQDKTAADAKTKAKPKAKADAKTKPKAASEN